MDPLNFICLLLIISISFFFLLVFPLKLLHCLLATSTVCPVSFCRTPFLMPSFFTSTVGNLSSVHYNLKGQILHTNRTLFFLFQEVYSVFPSILPFIAKICHAIHSLACHPYAFLILLMYFPLEQHLPTKSLHLGPAHKWMLPRSL